MVERQLPKRSYFEIQTYEHDRTHGRVHIDPQGQFYDRHAQPITREAALDHALGQHHHHHAHHGKEPPPLRTIFGECGAFSVAATP